MATDLKRWMVLMETQFGDEDDSEYSDDEDEGEDEPYTTQPAYKFQQELHAALLSSGLDGVCEVITREEDRQTVELYQITTKASHRQRGLANQAMEILTSLADKHDVWLTLEAAANMDGQGMSTGQLERWYDQWGFYNTGKRMMRSPGA